MTPVRLPRVWLALIVAIAALLRFGLAMQGGQNYFGDEYRFVRGEAIYSGVVESRPDLVIQMLGEPEHTGFSYIAAAVSAFEDISSRPFDRKEGPRIGVGFRTTR